MSNLREKLAPLVDAAHLEEVLAAVQNEVENEVLLDRIFRPSPDKEAGDSTNVETANPRDLGEEQGSTVEVDSFLIEPRASSGVREADKPGILIRLGRTLGFNDLGDPI